ncbi:MAG: hypothetical protein K0U78_15275 [Actinomycetia bacterium]|nr:hypothetical protein [Actinomycetes bacterium]
MKVLINNDFKALRQGDFLTASDDSSEFIFDTENNKLMPIQLLEIASSNKITVNKNGSAEEIVSELETGLLKLNLPEMNEMSNSEKVLKIVTAGFEAGLKDDDMLMQMVQEGIPFRQCGGLFRQCVEQHGFRISAKKRTEQVSEILESNEFYPETFSEVQEMCERIAVGNKDAGLEKVPDTTTNQALKLIKKFLKEKEIEFPKAPKKPKGGLRERYLNFAAANPQASDEDLAAWYRENTKNKSEEDVSKWMNRYHATVNHGRAIASFVLATEGSEVYSYPVEEATEEASQED